jgi:hypothetical protein
MEIFNTFAVLLIKNSKCMKQIFRLTCMLILLLSVKQIRAVEKGDFNTYVTTNLGHHSFIPTYSVGGLGFIPGVTLNMDYAASPYFGIGGWFTFSGKKYGKFTNANGTDDYLKYRSFGVGVRGVFHLYQLISEKGNTKLDAEKFDVYIPLAVGGGFRLKDKNLPGSKFAGGAIVGSGIGMSYYFVEHIGANLEAGYLEGSYAKIGLVFKF